MTAAMTDTRSHIVARRSVRSAQRLRAIVDEHYEFLWRSLRRLGVPEAGVEDSAQQVLLVLSQRIDGVALGAEKSFLFATALRVAADARKKLSRAREISEGEGIRERRDESPAV